MSTIRCPLYNKLIVNIQLLILQLNCKKKARSLTGHFLALDFAS